MNTTDANDTQTTAHEQCTENGTEYADGQIHPLRQGGEN
jgi:hypothetical protein